MPSKKTFCQWLLCQRRDNLFARWVFGDLVEWEGSKVKLRLLSNKHDKLDQYYDTCKKYDMYLRDLEYKRDKKKVIILLKA